MALNASPEQWAAWRNQNKKDLKSPRRDRLQCNFGPLVYGKARTTSENNIFFAFTISSLVSLLLSRFYRSKKYVRDIYQPDWKSEPSVGPGDPSARQSDRGTPYMFIVFGRVRADGDPRAGSAPSSRLTFAGVWVVKTLPGEALGPRRARQKAGDR